MADNETCPCVQQSYHWKYNQGFRTFLVCSTAGPSEANWGSITSQLTLLMIQLASVINQTFTLLCQAWASKRPFEDQTGNWSKTHTDRGSSKNAEREKAATQE